MCVNFIRFIVDFKTINTIVCFYLPTNLIERIILYVPQQRAGYHLVTISIMDRKDSLILLMSNIGCSRQKSEGKTIFS